MDVDAQLININRRLLVLEGKEPLQVTSEGPVGARDADGSRPAEQRQPIGDRDLPGLARAFDGRTRDLEERIAGLERFADVNGGPYARKVEEIEARLATFEERVEEALRMGADCNQRLVAAEDAIRRGTHHQPQEPWQSNVEGPSPSRR